MRNLVIFAIILVWAFLGVRTYLDLRIPPLPPHASAPRPPQEPCVHASIAGIAVLTCDGAGMDVCRAPEYHKEAIASFCDKNSPYWIGPAYNPEWQRP